MSRKTRKSAIPFPRATPPAAPAESPVQRALRLLYTASELAPLNGADRDAVRQAAQELHAALTPKEPALAVPPETPA